MVSNGIDSASVKTIFTNLTDTINKVEIVILVTIFLMTMLIILMVTLMVINDGKNLMAIMKTLGYRDSLNTMNFLSIYIPTLIIAFVISIPLSFISLGILNYVVFNSLSVMIYTTIT
jgi:hypothetical protein